MCENEGVVLTARPDQGPLVTFAHDYSLEDKLRKLCYLGACFDGFLLAMRSMEYLSKSKKFDRMEALSRADVVIGSDGTAGVMFIKRHKGDKRQQWPAKQFSPALGGKLCALALRLVYERLAVECRPVDSTVLVASSYGENGRSSEVVQVTLLTERRCNGAVGGRGTSTSDSVDGTLVFP
jgi:hypothetical protein